MLAKFCLRGVCKEFVCNVGSPVTVALVGVVQAVKVLSRSILAAAAAAVALRPENASAQRRCTLKEGDRIKAYFPNLTILAHQIGLISLMSPFCKERDALRCFRDPYEEFHSYLQVKMKRPLKF